jgi:lipopolysaccharide transport system permease protein
MKTTPHRFPIVYSSASSLREPRRFFAEAFSDLRRAWEPATHLFLKNLRSQHRQSFLGYAWLLLPPLASAIVWSGLNYSGILSIGPTQVPYPIFVLAGTMFWFVFVDALKCPLNDLKNARDILGKVRVPHEAVILAGLGTVFFNFLIRALLLAGAFVFYGILPGWTLALTPLALLSIVCLGLAIGLSLAPLGLLYDDINRSLDVLLGFGFLITPVVYPVTKAWPVSLISDWNPLVPLLLTGRSWLQGGDFLPAGGFFAISLASLAALFAAWVFYRVARPHLVARL